MTGSACCAGRFDVNKTLYVKLGRGAGEGRHQVAPRAETRRISRIAVSLRRNPYFKKISGSILDVFLYPFWRRFGSRFGVVVGAVLESFWDWFWGRFGTIFGMVFSSFWEPFWCRFRHSKLVFRTQRPPGVLKIHSSFRTSAAHERAKRAQCAKRGGPQRKFKKINATIGRHFLIACTVFLRSFFGSAW